METPNKVLCTGQSLWINHASRELIHNGTLMRYIEDYSVTGVAFSIEAFHQALLSSQVYDSAISKRIKDGLYGKNLACSLILEDIRYAANMLRHVHERTDGVDGWAVLPVSPLLVYDKDILVEAISDLHVRIHRPNSLVTLLGLPESLEIIEEIVFAGIPINIAFIYSHDQCLRVAKSCLRGIERRISKGLKPAVPIFISISISRLAAVLTTHMKREAAITAAIAMAQKIYQAMKSLLGSRQWEQAYNAGARPLRLVWGNSINEDAAQSDIFLHNDLIAPLTVAALPERSIKKFINTALPDSSMPTDGGDCEKVLTRCQPDGLSFETFADKLQDEDVTEQIKKWIMMLELVAQKSARISQQKTR